MRSRVLAGVLLLLGVSSVALVATNGVAPARQWAIVQLERPTLIAGRFAVGTVLFVHDDTKMAAGLPCTDVFRFELGKGPTELVTSFHCTPKTRQLLTTFQMSTQTTPEGALRLLEYQFAGDLEGHGVPTHETARVEKHASCGCHGDDEDCCASGTCTNGCCAAAARCAGCYHAKACDRPTASR